VTRVSTSSRATIRTRREGCSEGDRPTPGGTLANIATCWHDHDWTVSGRIDPTTERRSLGTNSAGNCGELSLARGVLRCSAHALTRGVDRHGDRHCRGCGRRYPAARSLEPSLTQACLDVASLPSSPLP